MAPNTLEEQLVKYLTDAHSIERQALVQMKAAPRLAGSEVIAAAFEQHRVETEEHERLVTERLQAHDAKPSTLKDLAGALTGQGFGLFAGGNPDTTGKLIVHAYSYEHMEQGAWELVGLVAERAGDAETVAVAERVAGQERAMAERISGLFDEAVDVSLREVAPDDLGEQLDKYLADAHAIETQSLKLLDRGADMAGTEALADVYEQHRLQTKEHEQLLSERLQARGGSPSRVKDAALALGALNWGGFFAAQPDTPPKLAGFAYAVEYLEAGAYAALGRVARRAGDEETVRLAERIEVQERDAGERIRSHFRDALYATLRERSVAS